ncbi:MAG: hypothetical protein QOJ29_5177 [Thermoleophilaceae bacterium]|nr:hypothetical protein [Thermoleophilaceae bacterium]
MLRSSVGMDLTRRGLITRAAATAGGALGARLLTPGVVFAGSHGEAVFEMRLPHASGVIETKRTFELLGIEPAVAGTQVRARGLDGNWTEWLNVHTGHDHGPDGEHSPLSDPVWTGPARAFELRAERPLHGARVVLVDSGHPASVAAERYVDSGLVAGPGQPRIVARSSWATAACKPRVPAVFGAVELAFVHHTVSSNYYAPSQSAAMVRSICLFHKYGNGWNDIGYNFVVDRFGQVFEARAGGIDETIVGAQAGGYNVYSTGVALLGNYSYGGPNRKMFDALAELLAWKLSIHGIETPGTVTVQVTRRGAPYSRYRAGAHVKLNRIAGHRDADTTECPGSGMYRQLPRLRQTVRQLALGVSELSAAATASAPGTVTIVGALVFADLPVPGATIEVQQRSTTKPARTIATTTTNPDGTWAATGPLVRNAQLRAVFRGDDTSPAVVSAGIVATVAPQITLTAPATQVTPGGVVEFTGTLTPAKPRVSLVISQQQPDGSYITVRTLTFRTADDGSFSRSLGFPAAGQYQVIAHTSADAANALGTSTPFAITVA